MKSVGREGWVLLECRIGKGGEKLVQEQCEVGIALSWGLLPGPKIIS